MSEEKRKDDYEHRRSAYRNQRLEEARAGDAGALVPGEPGSRRLERELREFCVASGQDLADVDRFVQEVETEVLALIVK